VRLVQKIRSFLTEICQRFKSYFFKKVRRDHGLINYVDTKEKCSHLKKLTVWFSYGGVKELCGRCLSEFTTRDTGPQIDKHLPQSPLTSQ
jgi:hypothetical protein